MVIDHHLLVTNETDGSQKVELLNKTPERVAEFMIDLCRSAIDAFDYSRMTAAEAIDTMNADVDELPELAKDVIDRYEIAKHVDSEGIFLSLEDTYDRMHTPLDMPEFDHPHLDYAKLAGGCTTQVFQLELIKDTEGSYSMQSNREHYSVGSFDDSGNYVPFLTFLSRDHPVVAAQIVPELE